MLHHGIPISWWGPVEGLGHSEAIHATVKDAQTNSWPRDGLGSRGPADERQRYKLRMSVRKVVLDGASACY